MLRVLQINCQKASRSIISPKFVRALSTTRYSKSHEYVKIDGDIGTVGITDFAAAALGDIVFVDMPSVGTKFESGDTFGSVERLIYIYTCIYVYVSIYYVCIHIHINVCRYKYMHKYAYMYI
jgi:hypothetical protein